MENLQQDFGFSKSYSFLGIYIDIKLQVKREFPKLDSEPQDEYNEFVEYEVQSRICDIVKEKCSEYGRKSNV